MPIKKLVVKEFVANKEDAKCVADIAEEDEGWWTYTYFEDPETKKLYRPVAEFTIEGDNLTGDFVEVEI